MSQTRAYLDHNATAPVLAAVRDGVERVLAMGGNPSSVHGEGRSARALIDRARSQVADLVGADPARVIFTSGGTEANVTALAPAHASAGAEEAHCFVSAVEHPSVVHGGRFSAESVSIVAVTGDGVVDCPRLRTDLAAFVAARPGVPFLVSVMAANNETGVLQPVGEIASIAHEFGGNVHCDAVQAAGKIPLDMESLGVDMVSLSAHKIGGPQGVGALVLGCSLSHLSDPLITGGGQEQRWRAGTENVPGIVGFGIAADAARSRLERVSKVGDMRDRLESQIKTIASGAVVFAQDVERLPNTTCFAMDGMAGENLVIAFDLAGVALSAGAACSSGKVSRSHVLDAMGVDETTARAAIRVSLGDETSDQDIELFVTAWRDIYGQFVARQQAA